ncbi:hypothetical protein [Croceicoccus sp. BE223]|uniref:hypothetical protein n=1 Tax=Croceicoccus sp. BE223 TaxID=2817716 RepID=UPI0028639D15|nr:hypothetical protein [Croceicoccus sp. BE223]MDR7102881.1 hypothetical protein [Croceicoccus sp. BE223]
MRLIAASAQDRDRVAMELVVAGQRLELSGRIIDASTHTSGPVEAPVSLVGMFRSHRTRRADGTLCNTSH